MVEQQLRLEIQSMVQRVLDSIKQQNQISPSVMEDAINKYLVGLKEEVLQEFIAAITVQTPSVPQEEEEFDID
jgi:hypothetical protein